MTRQRADWIMTALALLIIPLLVIEHQAKDPTVLLVVWIANALIWLAFVADYIWGLVAAEDRRLFVRTHWFDLAIIVLSPPFYVPEGLQGVRSLRALRVFQIGRLGRLFRLLRLLRIFSFLGKAWSTAGRLMGRHSFAYVILTCMLFVVGGGALFTVVEGGELNLLDGIWWAVATLTTVGYGDLYPKTEAGRAVAVLIILMGLGMMAALTANIAAHFVGSEQKGEQDELLRRLDEMSARMARMEQHLAALQQAAGKEQERP